MGSLFGWFRQNRHRRRLKEYLAQVRRLLRRTFGKAEYYSPKHIVDVIGEAELPLDDIRFALALFSTHEDYSQFRSSTGLQQDYWQTRREIADLFFRGNISFSRQDVIELLMPGKPEPYETGLHNFSDSP